MPANSYPVDLVAQARHLVTHAHDYMDLPANELADDLSAAWAVLRDDLQRRRRARVRFLPIHPGDAA